MAAKRNLDTSTEAKRNLDTSTEAKRNLDTSTEAKRNLDTSTEARRNLDTSTEARRNLDTSTEARHNLDTSTETRRNLDTSTEARHNLDTSTEVRHNLDTSTEANRNLDTNTEARRNLDTSTEAKRNLDTNTEARHNLDTSTEARRNLDTSTEARHNLDTSTEARRNLDTSTEARRNLDTSTEAKRNLDTNTEARHTLDTSTEARRNLDTSTEARHNLDTSTEARHNLDTSTEVRHNLDTSTEANRNLDTNTEARRNLDTSTEAKRNLDTNTEARHNLDTSTEARRNLDTSTEARHNLDTSTEARRNLDTSTEARRNLDTSTEAKRNLDTNTEARHTLDTSTEARRNLDTSTEARHNLDTSTEARRNLDTSTEARRNLDTSTEARRNLDTSTEANRNLDTSTEAKRNLDTSTEARRNLDTSTEAMRNLDTSTEAMSADMNNKSDGTTSPAQHVTVKAEIPPEEITSLADLIGLCRDHGFQVYNDKRNIPESDRLRIQVLGQQNGYVCGKKHKRDDRVPNVVLPSTPGVSSNSSLTSAYASSSASTGSAMARLDRDEARSRKASSLDPIYGPSQMNSRMSSTNRRSDIPDDNADAEELLQLRMRRRSKKRRENRGTLMDLMTEVCSLRISNMKRNANSLNSDTIDSSCVIHDAVDTKIMETDNDKSETQIQSGIVSDRSKSTESKNANVTSEEATRETVSAKDDVHAFSKNTNDFNEETKGKPISIEKLEDSLQSLNAKSNSRVNVVDSPIQKVHEYVNMRYNEASIQENDSESVIDEVRIKDGNATLVLYKVRKKSMLSKRDISQNVVRETQLDYSKKETPNINKSDDQKSLQEVEENMNLRRKKSVSFVIEDRFPTCNDSLVNTDYKMSDDSAELLNNNNDADLTSSISRQECSSGNVDKHIINNHETLDKTHSSDNGNEQIMAGLENNDQGSRNLTKNGFISSKGGNGLDYVTSDLVQINTGYHHTKKHSEQTWRGKVIKDDRIGHDKCIHRDDGDTDDNLGIAKDSSVILKTSNDTVHHKWMGDGDNVSHTNAAGIDTNMLTQMEHKCYLINGFVESSDTEAEPTKTSSEGENAEQSCIDTTVLQHTHYPEQIGQQMQSPRKEGIHDDKKKITTVSSNKQDSRSKELLRSSVYNSERTGTPSVTEQFATTGTHSVTGQSATTGTPSVIGLSATTGIPSVIGQSATIGTPSVIGQSTTTRTHSVTGHSATTGTPSVTGQSTTIGTPSVIGQSTMTGTHSVTGHSATTGTPSVTGQYTTTGTPSATEQSATTGTYSVTGHSATTGTPSVTGQSTTTGTPSVTEQSATTETYSVTGHSATTGTPSVTGQSTTTGTPSVTEQSATTGTHSVTAQSAKTGTHSVTGLSATTGTHSVTGLSATTGTHSVTGLSATTGTHSVTGLSATTGTHSVAGLSATTGTHSVAGLSATTGTHSVAGLSATTGTHSVTGLSATTGTHSVTWNSETTSIASAVQGLSSEARLIHLLKKTHEEYGKEHPKTIDLLEETRKSLMNELNCIKFVEETEETEVNPEDYNAKPETEVEQAGDKDYANKWNIQDIPAHEQDDNEEIINDIPTSLEHAYKGKKKKNLPGPNLTAEKLQEVREQYRMKHPNKSEAVEIDGEKYSVDQNSELVKSIKEKAVKKIDTRWDPGHPMFKIISNKSNSKIPDTKRVAQALKGLRIANFTSGNIPENNAYTRECKRIYSPGFEDGSINEIKEANRVHKMYRYSKPKSIDIETNEYEQDGDTLATVERTDKGKSNMRSFKIIENVPSKLGTNVSADAVEKHGKDWDVRGQAGSGHRMNNKRNRYTRLEHEVDFNALRGHSPERKPYRLKLFSNQDSNSHFKLEHAVLPEIRDDYDVKQILPKRNMMESPDKYIDRDNTRSLPQLDFYSKQQETEIKTFGTIISTSQHEDVMNPIVHNDENEVRKLLVSITSSKGSVRHFSSGITQAQNSKSCVQPGVDSRGSISAAVDIVQSRNTFYKNKQKDPTRGHRVFKLFQEIRMIRRMTSPLDGSTRTLAGYKRCSNDPSSGFLCMNYDKPDRSVSDQRTDVEMNRFLYENLDYEVCAKVKSVNSNYRRRQRAFAMLKQKIHHKS